MLRPHHIPLTLVRVQRRPDSDGALHQSAVLLRYIADLKTYVEGRGIGFYDFTGEPETPLEVYGEGDHIAPVYLDAHTDLFARRLAPRLR